MLMTKLAVPITANDIEQAIADVQTVSAGWGGCC